MVFKNPQKLPPERVIDGLAFFDNQRTKKARSAMVWLKTNHECKPGHLLMTTRCRYLAIVDVLRIRSNADQSVSFLCKLTPAEKGIRRMSHYVQDLRPGQKLTYMGSFYFAWETATTGQPLENAYT